MGIGREKLPTIKAIPVWQRIPKRFVSYDEAGGFIPHGFFDLAPFVSIKQNMVNFVMTTPIKAKYRYAFDLASGGLYRQHRYCKRDDVADKYGGYLYLPPYTEGFVPRLLDQIGMPQQIIVFGDEDHLNDFDKTTNKSQRVRVVGGVLKQYCKTFPCQDKDWRTTIVLVAVNPLDNGFKGSYKYYRIGKRNRLGSCFGIYEKFRRASLYRWKVPSGSTNQRCHKRGNRYSTISS